MINELFRIADGAGVTVEYCRLPLNESISFFDKNGDFVLMDYTLIASPSNEAVHLAHELGHCMTGSFYNPYAMLDIREKHERRANKWSYERLLPYDELMRAISDGLTEVWQIAERFGLPDEFTANAVAYYHERFDRVS